MAKGSTGKVQHQKMKPVEGAGFSLRGFRRAVDCPCGGATVYGKVVRVKGSARMGAICAGREAQKRKGFFFTADGKTTDQEISEKEYRLALSRAEVDKTDSGVMEAEVIVRPEIKPCGQILGRNKGNIFGAA